LVIPEIQATTRAKGIRLSSCSSVDSFSILTLFCVQPFNMVFLLLTCSPKFKSFSYLYDEEHFIAALSNDVAIVHGLPKDLREARKRVKFPTVSPRNSATPEYYRTEVLPRLVKSKVIGIIVNGGNCLQVFSRPLFSLPFYYVVDLLLKH
jgi:hypothetical protein